MTTKDLKCDEADLENCLVDLFNLSGNFESSLSQPKKGVWVFKARGKEYTVTKVMSASASAAPTQIARLKSDWEKVAKEKVEVEEQGNAFYAYGSELACLRLFYHYRHSISKIEAQYSSNLKTWTFRLDQ